MTEPAPTPLRRAAAWGVHLLTASSAPAGVLAILATIRGDVRTAFAWMAYTIAVDAIDGTLARAVGVKTVLPSVDGARLDDVVDYFTWVVVPAVFAIDRGLLPPAVAVPVAAAMLVASAYGFAQTDAKTADHYFTGFPSYWNIVVFYLYALGWSPAANAVVLLGFSVLVFVPIRYVYPSRTPRWRALTNGLGIAWGVALIAAVALPAPPRRLVEASLAYPVYYLLLSLALQRRHA